ncbi:MAG: DUF2911 domain-containing protein [Saprospiraceae bacterium]|nr:DUF2911 domain-containing protein [Saprospiraceae bacterium]
MKHRLFVTVAFFLLFLGVGFAQLDIPAASPSLHISQSLGLTTFDLQYARPSLKGRRGFGAQGVVPYAEPWRLGANAATFLSADKDFSVGGQPLPKGKYAILVTPNTNEWRIHFYVYGSSNWGSYLDQESIAEITTPVRQIENRESLLIYFDDLTLETANLVIEWAQSQVSVPIAIKEHEAILSQIDRRLSGPEPFDYYLAALYLHESGSDLAKALTYIKKVTAGEKALFFQVYREALILKDLDRPEEALVAARRSLQLAEQSGNMAFAKINRRLIMDLEG